MHQPIYRQIIRQAWTISWRNKTLWIFGFFAAFLINGGVYDLGIKMFTRTTWLSTTWQSLTTDSLPLIPSLHQALVQTLDWSSMGVIAVTVIFVIVALLFIAVSIICQGSLIHGIRTILKKKTINKEVIDAGLEKFWPVLGINVFLKAGILLLVIFVSFALFMVVTQSILLNAVVHLLSYLIFIPLAIVFYFMAILASCYIVLRDKPFFSSIALAWQLFARNWLICLELGFLLFVIAFLIGLVMLLIFLILSVPVVLLLLGALALQSDVAYLVTFFLTVFIIFVVIILGGSFTVTFQYTSWVLLFERLTTKGGFSRLTRWVGQLAGLHKIKPPKKRVVRRKKK